MSKMSMIFRGLLVCASLALILAGCGAQTGGATLAGTPNPAPTESGAAATATASYPAAAEVSIAAAKQDLAGQLNIDAVTIQVMSVTEQTWEDTRLGCSPPPMNPVRVITPGYRIILSVRGQQYEYHTDKTGKVVSCGTINVATENGVTGGTATANPTYPPEAVPAIAAARADLAKKLNIDIGTIAVIKVEEHEWPNEALGCGPPLARPLPQKGVPGYLITLAAGGTSYGYHADKNGKVAICSTK